MTDRTGQRLVEWAAEAAEQFDLKYEDSGCCCFTCAPCGWCTHPGNPSNQEDDDSCWEPDPACKPAVDFSAITRSMCK